MSEILFLSHRIPYPPDKGDKIRSYHLLKALAERHTVHLGTFIDDPADWAHVEAVQRLCGGETCIRPLNPRTARLRSARGLLAGKPLTLAYYCDRELHRWVGRLAERRSLVGVFAFSSSMGQYAEQVPLPKGAPRVLDFCDVDSDKWRQYAAGHGLPLNLVYGREARTLESLESRYVESFNATLVISDAEADILRRVTGQGSGRIRVVPNGVDTDYFDPTQEFVNPFEPAARPIVFTGAMDYQANVDGVRWFADRIFPAIHSHQPTALFAIVGSNPTAEVTALGRRPGVLVTGRVPDVRPYLAHAAVVVAPLRIARGVQNKVLEALAMARPVVATPNAVQGIPRAEDAGIRVVADAASVAAEICKSLSRPDVTDVGRSFVLQRYDWRRHLETVCGLFDSAPRGEASLTGIEAACA
jgi:sugar transferase (PEP-CTERM/EpsH1 system associated)